MHSSDKYGAFANLIERLCSDDDTRESAVLEFESLLKGRPFGHRKPDLVSPLSEIYYSSTDARVRCICVAALTEFAEDDNAPDALFEALSDQDPFVVQTGIFALEYFPNPKAVATLCRFIESRQSLLVNDSAISRLGIIGDHQAVPTLSAVLLDSNNNSPQSLSTAAIALARCGQNGFDALIQAFEHSDPRIRYAAVVGLDATGSEAATIYLDRAMADSDLNVCNRARIRMGKRLLNI
jgi:HEAT repeat protein